MATFKDADGNDVEAFTEAEVAAKVTTAVTAKEAEYTPKLTALETELTGAKTALAERAGEFKQFRKLSDEAVAKLDAAQRTIYENGITLEEERQKRVTLEKTTYDSNVKAAIKAKAGSNDKLEAKMLEMWPLLGIEANTSEQMAQKAQMLLGAIAQTEPDLVATVANFTGAHLPPGEKLKEGQTFADSERGKAGASELGLSIEMPKA